MPHVLRRVSPSLHYDDKRIAHRILRPQYDDLGTGNIAPPPHLDPFVVGVSPWIRLGLMRRKPRPQPESPRYPPVQFAVRLVFVRKTRLPFLIVRSQNHVSVENRRLAFGIWTRLKSDAPTLGIHDGAAIYQFAVYVKLAIKSPTPEIHVQPLALNVCHVRDAGNATIPFFRIGVHVPFRHRSRGIPGEPEARESPQVAKVAGLRLNLHSCVDVGTIRQASNPQHYAAIAEPLLRI